MATVLKIPESSCANAFVNSRHQKSKSGLLDCRANILLIGVSCFAVFLRRLFFFAVFLRHQFFVAVILTPKIVFLPQLSCKYHHFYGYYEKHGIMAMYKVNKAGNFYV